MILVADDSEYRLITETLAEFQLDASQMSIDLPLLPAHEFTALAGEFCRRRGIPNQVWQPVVQALALIRGLQNQAVWSPAYLEQVSGVIAQSP